MASKQDIFTLVGKRIRAGGSTTATDYAAPPLADIIARIDRALRERGAA